MNPSLLIIVDCDGTIVEHKFPDLGEPLPEAFEVMRELQDLGHRLILNTCREDMPERSYLTEVIDLCKQNGVTFHAVNENNPTDNDFHFAGVGRKIYGHVHIDDKNFGGFPGWSFVRRMLIDKEDVGPLWITYSRSVLSG